MNRPAAPADALDQDLDLVGQVLSRGFPWLRFPGVLEEAFIRRTADERILKIVVAAFASIPVFAAVLVTDFLLAPHELPLAVALRLGVYAPAILLAVLIFRRLSYPALNEWLVGAGGLLAASISGTMAAVGSEPYSYVKVVELILVVTYIGLFARFWPLALVCLGAAAVHVGVLAVSNDVIGTIGVASTLLLTTTIVFVLVAGYKLEHNERVAFLLDRREHGLIGQVQSAHHRLDAMARTDALTGAANRRYFDEFLALSWQRAHEQGRPLSLLLIDVDHFKAFNDLYGHQAGDHCLCVVTEAIASCLRRPVDLLARWGGEEFVAVIAEADGQMADQVAQRILQAVQACGLPHAGSSCAQVVTVSIGQATELPSVPDAAQAMVARADAALYQAKASGRNRVWVADEPPMLASIAACPEPCRQKAVSS